VPRYRFGEFVLSPRRRLLLRNGQEQPLIPRYFDLLVFLVERRHEAVHRRDIFDGVWRDVIVSDSALSQAIRTLRRTLCDDPREPRFIRTVSRHGYRFVYADVAEDDDDMPPAAAGVERAQPPPFPRDDDRFEALLERLTRAPATRADEEDRREAAEMLHGLGTGEALRRLGTRPGHASARALLRDARWDLPQAGPVPLLGQPGALRTVAALVALRLRRAGAIVAARWAAAAAGSGLAGAAGGAAGGLALTVVPGSDAPPAVIAVLALIGAVFGATGGAGTGAGLAAAEATARSRRRLALAVGGAAGGAIAGSAAQFLVRWTLATLLDVRLPIGGAIEGLVIGGAAGVAYGFTTARADGGLAAPRGRKRARTAASIAIACGAAALLLTLAGRPLVGGTVHLIASAAQASARLTPLARLFGETEFGRATSAITGTGEGLFFGLGLGLGLTRRP
jgi:DNA-binding winged helix-turn-helix (wHTH) protein